MCVLCAPRENWIFLINQVAVFLLFNNWEIKRKLTPKLVDFKLLWSECASIYHFNFKIIFFFRFFFCSIFLFFDNRFWLCTFKDSKPTEGGKKNKFGLPKKINRERDKKYNNKHNHYKGEFYILLLLCYCFDFVVWIFATKTIISINLILNSDMLLNSYIFT